jgi:hypothetical protein
LTVEPVLLGVGEVLAAGSQEWVGAHPFSRESLEEFVNIRFGSRQKANCQEQQ